MLNMLNLCAVPVSEDNAGDLPQKYYQEKLLQWATESMKADLPGAFFQARLLCTKFPDLAEPGQVIVCAFHDVKLTADADYEDFTPADDSYPAKCIEAILEGMDWVEASVIFDQESLSFEWC
ncbi:hypothetical protein EBL_c19510 [Shimwellia blattae DSM 4481 = NBRC 105725]|uniref:Uncharacterized protein n=1 Tax=Shimwellia blattae (strain ATCC 29907 / DSM 4481 / JCM 1650 / NBRC 105725 / CDC 9005-74) TaxID=630626 RepID=I2B939_SHIBC|nr:hypothetical protein [Shimwellia blattae]AFJ47043.1 hypothetical protein EBL_c19510 [Shimwellia blattae DSM 4481 = NBRC 105725]GAB80835.1 hypothetical protein EB105725_10_00220 [Shimwellia blattae DSM 4481 = NBRC 105725]VDY64536.1 Uncharacterised protein [Shimwellia blattae]VEC22644.1 Uncharacterised protein [Shimwellia blattae]